ncbi:unnamed protein product [Didymodactylos carnosus]|uniref:Cation-transporting ATPase n=2 Tax=Didymodactylos carnosus TaxID=1234261 RepID=A0A814QUU9_9BILA|nr:unnamed protein product [Didymodactylos carnosus]CAF3888076.1 unnamed protein product [Didymodactylos carnosus]
MPLSKNVKKTEYLPAIPPVNCSIAAEQMLLKNKNFIGQIPLNDDIYSVSLYCFRHFLLHLNIGPFVFFYLTWFVIWIYHFGLSQYPELGIIITVIIAIIHIVICLFCYWFVEVRAFMQCYPERTPSKAEVVVVKPTANNGYPEMVPLHHGQDPQTHKEQVWFMFQKSRYVYDESEKKTFQIIDYPLSNSFHTYLQSKGLQNDEIDQATWNFGSNRMVIDIPKFIDLFIERATAPFFVFQVFCVLLWCLDEYWYYSILTLFMLITFEVTLVQQQKRNMATIRTMGNQPYKISVYRQRKWIKIDTTDILPGDICSVLRTNENNPLPCDMLLLRGQCIVDESMLTGESIPQMKVRKRLIDELVIFQLPND